MDNVNFSSSITSWTGGDLIYKGSDLSSIASNNKIKVGDKACTTSGQGYTSNSAADDGIPQVGCVLPDLAVGTHAVTISTDGGASYTINAGKVIYTQTPTLSGCDTTSMQTFGANATACKASMQQGQVIVLNDTRGNSDSPNGQKYRVKKMPDGYVWMIDNLKLGSTTNTTVLTPVDTNITSNFTLSKIDNSTANSDPTSTTYCSSSGLVNTHNPGNTTGCGYLYDWYTAMAGTGNLSGYSISPKGWSLPDCAGGNSDSNICRTSEKSFLTLSNKMLTAAADSNDNRNPVYSTTDYKNFNEGGTNYPSPWLGVYAGGHDCYSTCEDKIDHQGINGYYLSSDYHYHAEYAYSWIYNNNSVNTVLLRLINGHSFRSVLY
jgi:uncharacterized protein (TIGR02145 family)